MYDEEAVRRIEQILILRKLNISIKDIQRIFKASGSDVVLEVLGRKVNAIDDEVSLLNELKGIVLDFIEEIEKMNFSDNADIKQLYNKAKDIETSKYQSFDRDHG
jgi:DNA-binding transcriptional MerR regulator